MGKAVIVTGTTGQRDVIVHEHNGLCVAPGDVQAWRDTIERLRRDDVLRTRLGRAARRWLVENATLDRWVENIVASLRDPSAQDAHSTRAPAHLDPASAAT